jgi:hypothetical protein
MAIVPVESSQDRSTCVYRYYSFAYFYFNSLNQKYIIASNYLILITNLVPRLDVLVVLHRERQLAEGRFSAFGPSCTVTCRCDIPPIL